MKITLICLRPPLADSFANTSGKDNPKGEIAPSDKPPILKKSRRLIAIAVTLDDLHLPRKPERRNSQRQSFLIAPYTARANEDNITANRLHQNHMPQEKI